MIVLILLILALLTFAITAARSFASDSKTAGVVLSSLVVVCAGMILIRGLLGS